MSLIDNERTKLTANWLNALAAGVVVTGVVAPAVGVIYGVQGPSGAGYLILAISSVVWLAMGTALHFLGKKAAEGIATVNWFEIYALFGAPVVALGLGILVYFIASRTHGATGKKP